MRIALLPAVTLALAGYGQEATRLVFDVASIKPHAVPTDRQTASFNNGVLFTTNVRLRQLMGFVYHVEEFQILGGPPWMADDGWDIEARALNDTTQDEKTLPEQERNALGERFARRAENLLADRFGLVFRRETRQETTYELHVETGGHKLAPAKDGVAAQMNRRMNGGRGGLGVTGFPLASIVVQLSRIIGRPVTDKTGLDGRFNFQLDWTAQIGEPGAVSGQSAPVGPSIFTAVKEQLGLRLNAVKGPTEVLIVAKVERPSEN